MKDHEKPPRKVDFDIIFCCLLFVFPSACAYVLPYLEPSCKNAKQLLLAQPLPFTVNLVRRFTEIKFNKQRCLIPHATSRKYGLGSAILTEGNKIVISKIGLKVLAIFLSYIQSSALNIFTENKESCSPILPKSVLMFMFNKFAYE
jgi:hypothetical protein